MTLGPQKIRVVFMYTSFGEECKHITCLSAMASAAIATIVTRVEILWNFFFLLGRYRLTS